MKSDEIRKKYIEFFKANPRNHVEIPAAPLVLENDPTTLFTSSGMQPLVPYLMGEAHPSGKRLVDSQPSIRTVDIDEVGDNRHLTFFEMLGNWSLGDYFKEEQLVWSWEFLTKELGLPKERLWVTVFEGNEQVSKDEESFETWKKIGLPEKKIFYYGVDKNWWSRSGSPEQMPVGEIGGPDSEVFFEFTQVKHDSKFGKDCHPNCECGRFLEIGNSVFIQYKKVGEEKLEELKQRNVDFGGGLERIVAAVNDISDIYQTDLFKGLIAETEKNAKMPYLGNEKEFRVIADHLKASVFMIANGVFPSNKEQGYVLRRLLRRAVIMMNQIGGGLTPIPAFQAIADQTVLIYGKNYLESGDKKLIYDVFDEELNKFAKTLDKGLKILRKEGHIDAKTAFDLYQSYGFPPELTLEIAAKENIAVDENIKADMDKHIQTHKEKSRSLSAGVFKGGLADHSPEVVRLHTATHLLLASLRKVLGEHIVQKGQNITKERARFDFSNSEKLEESQLKKVENMINEVVQKDLPVGFKVLPKNEAERTGAIHAFGEKYADTVKVYYVGEDLKTAFSKEFCGGPHVGRTGEIGRVRIIKQDKIGSNLIRIYAVFQNGRS